VDHALDDGPLFHGTTADLRIAVVGPGAIGTTIAAALHEQGRTPLVAGRSARADLRLRSAQGTVVVPGPVLTDPAEVRGTVDVVFLAVKATQTAAAADWLVALSGPGTVVCVLQNGVEQRAAVEHLVPGADVVPAVVWFPAVREDDGSVRLLGEPRLTVPSTAGGRAVQDVLRGTRCAVDAAEDFLTPAWRKLLQNAAAGLMAITGRRSGVFGRADLGDLTLAYLRECLAVARAEGAHLDDDEPQRTSILADREHGRPLEWDVRNGVVRRLGRAHGIATPVSDVLVPLLAATSDGPG
jgi:2-dehydropantoate 2-reductase